MLCLIGCMDIALAQSSELTEGTDPLIGYWKQEQKSVYIHVVNVDGSYQAEMVRNDWAPGLVGTMFFQNVVEVKSNRWAGDGHIEGSDRLAKASLKMNRAGTKLTTRHKPGGSKNWERSEPVEKRY